jgi:hypothetical protein
MAKLGRPKQQTARRAVTRRSETGEEVPAVWISQMSGGVSYGVRDFGKLGKRATDRAIAEFLRVKHFVEVELKEIEAANQAELLKKSGEKG